VIVTPQVAQAFEQEALIHAAVARGER